MISPETYQALGLSDEEYQRILEALGREPTTTELAMFSVEWSEHCGYMSSRKLLATLPKTGKYEVTVGEDSGAVIVDDFAIVFKMESHNHPSQIEPFQGAATGVGGILRDIFTAGARPIATLNSLRFGNLKDPYNKHLLREVVRGIAWYGNCVGVPTVGGEIYFDDSYNGNCLVNAMTIGICHKDKLARARATGVGNIIMYVGSTTGRDGIGGCSVLASHEFDEGEAQRPTVQVGDPFMEKCLIEATLEALETGYIIGIKDMGAAGLTCSISEMAAAGGVGISVNLNSVPLREEGMEAWEIMISESQERMLVCIKHGCEWQVKAIFEKWGLEAAIIGTVNDTGKVLIDYNAETVCNVDAQLLTEAPTIDLPAENMFEGRDCLKYLDLIPLPDEKSHNTTLIKMLSRPTIASKRWVYEQYDHMVQTNTLVLPGRSDAAVIRIKGTNKAIAATVDCNSKQCYIHPRRGAVMAVIEAAQNLYCTGAEPIAVTDCLNFGSPKNPHVFWQFQEAIKGIARTCEVMELPVVSGNVSFYNESPDGPINPTPTIGMVGIIHDVKHVMTQNFKRDGDAILLLGPLWTHGTGHGEYLPLLHGEDDLQTHFFELTNCIKMQDVVLTAIREGFIQSAHDISEGGLAVTLAECCISGDEHFGANIDLASIFARRDTELFHEAPGRIIVSCHPSAVDDIMKICHQHLTLRATLLGWVGGKKLIIKHKGKTTVNLTTHRIHKAWSTGLEKQV